MSKALLEKARQALDTARLALDAGDTDATVNRAYYAAFYAAWAMMESSGRSRPKTHSGLIAEFNRQFVKDKTFTPAIGSILGKLENLRLSADYTMRSIPEPEAAHALALASEFVAAIEQHLVASGSAE